MGAISFLALAFTNLVFNTTRCTHHTLAGNASHIVPQETILLPPGCDVDFRRGPARSEFPKDFLFGAATSAFQVEGASHEDNKGSSVWDEYSHNGKIADGSNADIACDHYHQFLDDIKLLKNTGMNAFRFSIAWTRILPDGEGQVNELGISHYNQVIDALLREGLEPIVTLFHWDTPLALHEKYNAWLDKQIIKHYLRFVDVCFKSFGDRVKTWITLNEPLEFSGLGYGVGFHAPGRCTDRIKCPEGDGATEPYIVGHHLLLAHAAAVSLYRRQYQPKQNGRIGITLDMMYLYPRTPSEEDVAAALRGMEFSFGWFASPIMNGDYPAVMRQYLGHRLPKITAKQKELLLDSVDFFGFNFYTAKVTSQGEKPLPHKCNPWTDPETLEVDIDAHGRLLGEKTAAHWLLIVPEAMYDVLMWIKQNYGKYPIIITENGSPDSGDDREALICDKRRTKQYQDYLSYLAKAIKDGVRVEGFFAWSLLGNFEWSAGYSQRFGIYYVDFSSLTRTRYPKASAMWFAKFLKSNT